MGRLLMYFPENDLALAAGTAAYTPPPAARRLHAAGEALPLWMASPGDRFVCGGINARWLGEMLDTFGIGDVDVYDHRDSSLEASPWGWSAASRRALENAGYPAQQLPDDEAIGRLRRLSHRRTAAHLAREVQRRLAFAVAPAATEATDTAAVADYLARRGRIIAKAPWSCSGRGIVRSHNMPPEAFMQQAGGIIRRQGSVMLEPEHDKALDFAMLFEADGHGTVSPCGLSVFETNARGGYTANVLASQESLRRRVEAVAGDGRLEAVAAAVKESLPVVLGDYRGPLGVDMLVAADGTIDAVVELNLRYTMGFVALGVARYLADGCEGTLSVVPGAGPADAAPVVVDCRLAGGTLDLTPANPYFAFRVSVN